MQVYYMIWFAAFGRDRLWIEPSHPGQLSLANPPWVGKMSNLLAMFTATAREETANSE